MKQCKKCGIEKSKAEFYRHKETADGFRGECKACSKAANKDYYLSENGRKVVEEGVARYLETDRGKEARRKAVANYNKSKAHKENVERYRSRNPEKVIAHAAVKNMVRRKGFEKPSKCELCGDESRLDGHHHDYSMVEDVEWLCRRCHNGRHENKSRSVAA